MDAKIFPSRLTIAISKQDRLKSSILGYLQSKGFVVEEDGETGILFDKVGIIPQIRIEFVRAADALMLMDKKVAQMAIIGSDIVDEKTSGENPSYLKPQARLDLNIATCRFELAVPNKSLPNIKTPADLNGLRIATSYPNMLGAWLSENDVTPSEILVREGGVESSIRMGLVDVVADIVDTGGTLRKNQLAAKFQIARTSAVCYSAQNTDVLSDLLVNEFVRNLKSRPSNQSMIKELEIA